MKISEILWKAANERLSEDWEAHRSVNGVAFKLPYSCDAVSIAARDKDFSYEKPAHDFLRQLGCGNGYEEFAPYRYDSSLQPIRYAWLMFAYEIAREVEAGKLKL